MTLIDIFNKHGVSTKVMCGADCGKGWYDIIDRLMADLIEMGWDKNVTQIKEKFGGLRFYIGAGSDEIHKRIDQAERESFKTCEECGKDGCIRQTGWLKTLCDDCL